MTGNRGAILRGTRIAPAHYGMKSEVRRGLLGSGVVICLLVWQLAVARDTAKNSLVSAQRDLMGTTWRIEVADHGNPRAAYSAMNRAWAELERIDALMSEWKPDSPISRINQFAGRGAVEAPTELREMLQRSIGYSLATEGVFDVTWRGMGRIWHFDDSFKVPTQSEVDRARPTIDYRKIRIEGNQVSLPTGFNIGLGGIAKGYAVDRASEVLSQAGFTDSLVDGGGDIRVHGTRLGRSWQLGVQNPRGAHGEVLGVVSLKDAAIASSGDYERFRIVNGVRYHHIIDPRTGWPAAESIAVTVISKTAEQGVVLDKAVFILGAEKGLALARAQGVDAMEIDPSGTWHMTPGFKAEFRTQ